MTFNSLDLEGKIRQWLADRYTPEAIRQGLAIFGTERDKGCLRNKTAHRYLVKVIQNRQEELDLRRQEDFYENLPKPSVREGKLKLLLEHCHGRISAICRHIRRLFEATWNDRFVLISNLVAWEQQLVCPPPVYGVTQGDED